MTNFAYVDMMRVADDVTSMSFIWSNSSDYRLGRPKFNKILDEFSRKVFP